VFGLLRAFCRDAVAIRLLLLVVRQTAPEFARRLGPLLDGLGLEAEHRGRSLWRLRDILDRLKELSVIRDYRLEEGGRLTVERNVDWHREPDPAAGGAGEVFLAHENPVFGT
jgi:hypothetical protein